jgi:DNA-cytosine methyltransferase
MSLLRQSVREQSRADEVALLLSAGIDSISVGLALKAEGKRIHAYTFEVHGYPSAERRRVEWIARHFGWKLTVITTPTCGLQSDFIELAVRHKCRKKVHFEVLWPLLYVLPQILEAEVWTGWNADDHYGNTKKIMLEQGGRCRDGLSSQCRKRHFDQFRRELRAAFFTPESLDSWWYARRLGEHYGKRLVDAYTTDAIFEHFLQFNHEQLSRPDKPLVREALREHLRGLPRNLLRGGVRLQKGGQVHVVFKTLLNDSSINRHGSKSVSALCQRWGREVAKDPDRFEGELTQLPGRLIAFARRSVEAQYAPYVMRDVRLASSKDFFKCFSTFAGGGGSSTGYRLAGGRVIGACEFVPEAALTYRRNFPDALVDTRDIRQVLSDGAGELMRSLGIVVGELDILDGSPPCSEFSVAGTGIKDQSVLRPYSDVMQSGIATLPFDFMRLAQVLRPKIVVCENVPALATRYPDVLGNLLDSLRFKEGGSREYFASYSVLAADDFGVAQSRRRLFILGIRRDVAEAVGIAEDEAVRQVSPIANSSPITIRAALRDLQQDFKQVEPWRQSASCSSLGETIRRLPKCPEKHLRLSDLDPDDTSKFTLRRCSWDLPAPTLVVSGQRPDGMTGALHPQFDRKFTIPELKRLFGLPDDFIVTGTLRQAAERICRMVPPFLTKAIAKSVYDKVLMPYSKVLK